jgi:hypothetical protein
MSHLGDFIVSLGVGVSLVGLLFFCWLVSSVNTTVNSSGVNMRERSERIA